MVRLTYKEEKIRFSMCCKDKNSSHHPNKSGNVHYVDIRCVFPIFIDLFHLSSIASVSSRITLVVLVPRNCITKKTIHIKLGIIFLMILSRTICTGGKIFTICSNF